MKKLDIVLVGFGGYGEFYMDFLTANPYDLSFNFTAVVDPYLTDGDKSRLTALGILYFAELEAFFAERRADLVIIAAPIHFHKPMCEIALKNKAAALCEKPPTARLLDLYEMMEYEKTYKKDIFVGFQALFSDPVLGVKKDLLAGRYGKIISCKSIVLWSRDQAYFSRTTGWAGKIRSAGGEYIYDSVVSNATAHYLNNLLFLLGDSIGTAAEIKEIQARCSKANPIESFDTCVINAKTVKDQEILYIASHAVDKNVEPLMEIVCEKAVISYDFAVNSGALSAKLSNGEVIGYGEVNTLAQQQKKAVSVINWLNGSSDIGPPSRLVTALPFMQIIDYLFENVAFEKCDNIVFDEENNRYYAEGLSDRLYDLYKNS